MRGKKEDTAKSSLRSQNNEWQLLPEDYPSSEDFKIKEEGDKVLFVPGKGGMMKRSSWTPELLPFRSLVISKESGKVLSAGFPKFFNYEEDQENTELLNKMLENGDEVIFTEKLDGSLMIRSVIDNQINLRTRGQIGASEHTQAALKVAEDKYPKLLDPAFKSDYSLLFEFVSPNPKFRIVIRYQEDDLILVGAIRNKDLSLVAPKELEKIQKEGDLQKAKQYSLPKNPKEMLETIKSWKEKEGVVAYFQGNLLKLKAEDYLSQHRLRFALSAKVVKQICLEENVGELKDFEKYLQDRGGDWELVEDSRPLVETFISTKEESQKEFEQMQKDVQENLQKYPDRKQFAVNYAVPLGGKKRGAVFALADQKTDQAWEILLNDNLNKAFEKMEEYDEKLEARQRLEE